MLFRSANWITNDMSTDLVHKWRSEEQAIMVGTRTAFFDNPQLNVRNWVGENPVRIVLDGILRLPAVTNLFDGSALTLVFIDQSKEREAAIKRTKENLEYIPINFKKNVLNQVLKELYNREIQSVIIEGGRILLNSFLENYLWDEARVFVGNKKFKKGIESPNIPAKHISEMIIDNDRLLVYRNK